MRCRLSPTADVPSHTSGAAMCHTRTSVATGAASGRPSSIRDAKADVIDLAEIMRGEYRVRHQETVRWVRGRTRTPPD